MDEYEFAQQVMDDDGAGSAITSVPAGQGTPAELWTAAYDQRCQAAARKRDFTGHNGSELPDPVHHGDVFSRIDASTAGERP